MTQLEPFYTVPFFFAGSSKENHDPSSDSGESCSKKKRLSVIAQHRRLGEESLCKLKEEVRRFAVDHTFKETAKKFGIHHSTVSGWVKAGEQVSIVLSSTCF